MTLGVHFLSALLASCGLMKVQPMVIQMHPELENFYLSIHSAKKDSV